MRARILSAYIVFDILPQLFEEIILRNMSHRYDHEKYLIGLALDEIEHAIHGFDSNSPEDYLDWEFDVDRCIGNFPPYSCRLGAVIVEKLVGFTKSWWRFYMIGRMMDGYGDKVHGMILKVL